MRALLLAILGLFLLPAVAPATPPGQEGRIVLHPLAGQGTVALIDPVPSSTPVLPPALAPAGDVAGSSDGQRLAAASISGNEQLIVVAEYDGTDVTPVPGTKERRASARRPRVLADGRPHRVRR